MFVGARVASCYTVLYDSNIPSVAQLVRAPSLYLGGSWFESRQTELVDKVYFKSIIKSSVTMGKPEYLRRKVCHDEVEDGAGESAGQEDRSPDGDRLHRTIQQSGR